LTFGGIKVLELLLLDFSWELLAEQLNRNDHHHHHSTPWYVFSLHFGRSLIHLHYIMAQSFAEEFLEDKAFDSTSSNLKERISSTSIRFSWTLVIFDSKCVAWLKLNCKQ
jgi:hypothetical protein